MSLHKKTLLIVGVTLVSLIGALYATSSTILLAGFAEVEERDTRQNVKRVQGALSDELAQLNLTTRDWAEWNETYAFIEDGNKAYVRNYLNDISIAQIKLNLMVYVHTSGRIVFSKGIDIEGEKAIPISKNFQKHLSAKRLFQHSNINRSVKGLILLPEGSILIASRPILNDDSRGSSRGTLIMGRYLDAAAIKRLAKRTHLSITMHRFDDAQMPADFQAVRSSLSGKETIVVRPLSEQTVAGYTWITDIYGNPALIMRVDVPRDIYQQGKVSIRYLVLSLLALGLVFGVATLLLLEQLVLSRLSRLSANVRRIGTSGDLSGRVLSITGKDELSSLAGTINDMLQALSHSQEALQKAYDELEIRVRERTAELVLINSELQAEIIERNIAEEKLLYDAFHDSLTGLANRALFINRLDHALERAKRRKDYVFAVLFLDLDRFKVVNDSLGHLLGDQLLIVIAHRLQACLRAEDTVARLGGDEFTILLEDIQDLEDATQVADRIQKELALPFNLSGYEVFTAVSVGIALSTHGYDRPEDLLRDADTTMYRAKALGKGRFEVFDQTMHAQAMALLQLETDLRRAIERGEFRIHYQPIVALNSGRITGFEALVRWKHSLRGLVSPLEFIPVAEETGLIIPIGWYVLREACHQLRAWQERFVASEPLTISVNFSAKQFSQPYLVKQIDQILHETNLNACSLKLEITESVLVANPESAAAILWQLKKLGVQLYIDDFGTGYSSLSYLHRFPIDALKIDRSFISRMSVDNENLELVRTIITMAHNLSMNVVAEGVETAQQLAQLRALQCEYCQGYFFSKPLNKEAAQALINKWTPLPIN